MPRYHFRQYVTEYFSVEADSEEEAWDMVNDGSFHVRDSDINDTELDDVEALPSDKPKFKVGEMTRIPFPDGRAYA
jgi:hypothetical protein